MRIWHPVPKTGLKNLGRAGHQPGPIGRAKLASPSTVAAMYPLLTMTELCEALRISRSTLYRIRRDDCRGFPAGIRIGNRYRWYAHEVQTYMERNRESFADHGYIVSARFSNPRRPYTRLRAVA